MKNILKRVLFTVSVYITIISLVTDSRIILHDNSYGMFWFLNAIFSYKYNLIGIFIFLVIYQAISKIYNFKVLDKIFVLIFSILVIISDSYENYDSLSIVNKSELFVMIIQAIGIYYLILLSISTFLNLYRNNKNILFKKIPNFFTKSWFFFLVIFISWFIYALFKYPASFEWDAYHQLMMIVGDYELNAWWPLSSTFFFGYTYKFFLLIFKSSDFSIFMVVVVQLILCTFCFTYSLKTIKRLTNSSKITLICLVIYALCPIYGRYLSSIVKDALYASTVVLFTSLLIEYLMGDSNYNKLSLVAFFVSILRYNGIYIVGILVILFLIKVIIRKDKRDLKLIICFISVIVLSKILHIILLNILGLTDINSGMKYGVFLQQTSRYLYYYGDELTEHEYNAISKVVDVEYIKNNYDPRLSDYAFETFKNPNFSELVDYFNVWLSMFFKHPGVYISSTFNNCYQFFYPNTIERENGIYLMTNQDEIKYFSNKNLFSSMNGIYRIFIKMIESFPLLNIFNNSGFSFIITIYMFIKSIISKNINSIIVISVSMIGILVCIVCPTYAHNGLRYALPIIYVIPLLLSWMYVQKNNTNCAKSD